MANNVYTYVNFHKISDAGKEKFNELLSRVRTDGNYQWLGDMWVDGKEGSPTYEETEKYEWTTTVIGPKWNYIEDQGDDFLYLCSAWSWPENGVMWIVDQISEVDPELIVTVTYEDEMPNFFGCAVFSKEGYVDSCEWDDTELREDMHAQYPELVENWDDEEEDASSEEYWDIWNDNVHEFMSDRQHEYIDIVLESMKDE